MLSLNASVLSLYQKRVKRIMAEQNNIEVRAHVEHNLKSMDVDIPVKIGWL